MAHKGKVQLLIVFTAAPEHVEQGDKLFASHAAWMAETHHRQGPKALLSYDVSKGPEQANALDPSSAPTGNTLYSLSEVYESAEGIADHWQQAQASWRDFGAMMEWAGKCNPKSVHGSPIIASLW